MSKGKQTSSEDIAKVIKHLVANPEASLRDVEKDTWVEYQTVNNIKKNMAFEVSKKSDIIADIVDSDKEMIQIANSLSLHKFKHMAKQVEDNPDKALELSEVKVLSEIADKSTKRVSIFWGDATDKNWGLKLPAVIEIVQPEKVEND